MKSSFRYGIIGLALALTVLVSSGCSALRVAYGTAPQLSWWWLDGYFDFGGAQSPAARQALDRWFDWHRATQLPRYRQLLAQLRADIDGPTTPALACRWQARVREQLDPALQRAVVDFAELVPGFGEAQFRALQRKQSRAIDEMRETYLEADPQRRAAKSVERAVKQTERLYGRLDEPQLKVIADAIAGSPFDPEAWRVERQRRQADTLRTLKALVDTRAGREQRIEALRQLAQRTERSPDPVYRAYQERLADYNCAFVARLHNATTAEQRRTARERLQGWEGDLQALADSAPPAPPPPT